MTSWNCLHTMALTFQEICQGEAPWIALGNFMNDWFDYAKEKRPQLVTDPILIPDMSNDDVLRWATFCTASVEWFCERYNVPCPSWVHTFTYRLPEPWFDSPGAYKPEVRERLIRETPAQFTKRNIYCGNRMFANKWELAEKHRQLVANIHPHSASVATNLASNFASQSN